MVISTGTRRFTFKARKSHCFDRALQHYYSPADWAREVFKPSTDSASLVVPMENFFFVLRIGISLVDIIMGTCFCPCGWVYQTLGANPKGHFFGSSYFGIYAVIQVFRAIDWLASISGAKIMTVKKKIAKTSTPANANLGCIPPPAITCQPIQLESCSKPLKMGESCSSQWKKLF